MLTPATHRAAEASVIDLFGDRDKRQIASLNGFNMESLATTPRSDLLEDRQVLQQTAS